MPHARDYRPPRWLRNPHLQSVLGSSALRRGAAAQALAATGAVTNAHIVDARRRRAPAGPAQRDARRTRRARWRCCCTAGKAAPNPATCSSPPRNCWRAASTCSGSTSATTATPTTSTRACSTPTASTKSCRPRRRVARRFATRPLVVAGYSLGGNFALRAGAARAGGRHAARARRRGVPGARSGRARWRRWNTACRCTTGTSSASGAVRCARKRELFPQQHDFDDRVLGLGMRGLTPWLVERYTEFGRSTRYFDGYAIAGDRLADAAGAGQHPEPRRRPDHSGRRLPRAATAAERAPGDRRARRPLRLPRELALRGFAERWVAEQLDSGGRAASWHHRRPWPDKECSTCA